MTIIYVLTNGYQMLCEGEVWMWDVCRVYCSLVSITFTQENVVLVLTVIKVTHTAVLATVKLVLELHS